MVMLAVVAIVLFVLSAIQQLADDAWGQIDPGLLNTVGLLFLAAQLVWSIPLNRRRPD